MGKQRHYRYFVGDFETTVFEGQTFTEVWASAVVEFGSEDVKILHSLSDTYKYLKKLNENIIIYFHNLKFDGSFWLDFLINELKLKEAIIKTGDNEDSFKWERPFDMDNNTFLYTISDRGQWYRIIIKTNNHLIEIRDSLKLLPFKVKTIGEDFKTKHKKLEMEYKGFRYAGCDITDEEQKYIANDVLVIKEALEIMYAEGHTKLTIGSCCMAEFKKLYKKELFDGLFPDMYSVGLDEKLYGKTNAGDYTRKSYKGGWCYLVKGKENRIYKQGVTADVNSLYPSMMHSESGNRFPVGIPTFWKGDYIPDTAKINERYYFVRIKTRFYIKKGKLPFIQIKDNPMYKSTEALESSDLVLKDGSKSAYYKDINGEWHDTRVTLTLTMTDYILFKEHYNLVDFEILDGCWFETRIGIFDKYIDKYREIKMREKGAKRQIAKLFLNNLYGKFASNKNSSFKFAYSKEDKVIGFRDVEEYDKDAGYIPIGSAITSYARNFTIRAAQKNYHGKDKRGFIYADTDSIHCDLDPNEVQGIKVDKSAFCCWKLESCWDEAIFVRQKTYIEHVTHEDLEPIDEPYYSIKCAGMPDTCKEIFNKSLTGYEIQENDNFEASQAELIRSKCGLTDFKVGLKIWGKLLPKRIQGGIILKETTFEMR